MNIMKKQHNTEEFCPNLLPLSYNLISFYHLAVSNAHCEARKKVANVTAAKKKEEFEACEMENARVRFYDVRFSKGRLPFLSKV